MKTSKHPHENQVSEEFDSWAHQGRGERMGEGHAELVDQVLDHWKEDQRESVLDLGCGTGKALIQAKKQGFRSIVGIDISESMIKRARKNLPSGDFHLASAESLPFKESRFTHILSVESVYYYQEPLKAFQEAFRVLRPGGRIGVAIEYFFENRPSHEWSNFFSFPIHLWKTEKWLDVLKQGGFENCRPELLIRKAVVEEKDFQPTSGFREYATYQEFIQQGALYFEGIKS